MDVSVIIVNYNTKQMTSDCINSVFEHTKDIFFEVLLVDNGSKDGSVELFSKDTRIHFVESGSNIGFGRANNLGYKHAKGKYIFFLNSDTLLLNNAIKLFHDKMEALPSNVSCIGTILINKDLENIHSYGEFPTFTRELIYRTFLNKVLKLFGYKSHYYDNPKRRKEQDFEVDFVTGADMFIRRKAFEQCSGFDSDFFMYFEDTDLQYRFKQNGYFQMITQGPSIIHLLGGSKDKAQKRILHKYALFLKSSFLYLKKHNLSISYKLYRILFFFCSISFFFSPEYTFNDKVNYYKELLK